MAISVFSAGMPQQQEHCMQIRTQSSHLPEYWFRMGPGCGAHCACRPFRTCTGQQMQSCVSSREGCHRVHNISHNTKGQDASPTYMISPHVPAFSRIIAWMPNDVPCSVMPWPSVYFFSGSVVVFPESAIFQNSSKTQNLIRSKKFRIPKKSRICQDSRTCHLPEFPESPECGVSPEFPDNVSLLQILRRCRMFCSPTFAESQQFAIFPTCL